MKDIDDYTDTQLLQSIEAEIAKATNEVRCLQGDADKINSRLRFALLALHIIKNRSKDKQ